MDPGRFKSTMLQRLRACNRGLLGSQSFELALAYRLIQCAYREKKSSMLEHREEELFTPKIKRN
jgi:hypothetical protein